MDASLYNYVTKACIFHEYLVQLVLLSLLGSGSLSKKVYRVRTKKSSNYEDFSNIIYQTRRSRRR